MYSWGDDISDWANPNAYAFDAKTKAEREAAAQQSKAQGPRAYTQKNAPILARTNPQKSISSQSSTPMIIAVDITGSMARWPFEIFDRLPLLYQTLSQWRQDLEISFMAVGDAMAQNYPFQVTQFARGFELESELGALHGESGGDNNPPESYGLVPWYIQNRVTVRNDIEKPFCIIFGDVRMEPAVTSPMFRKVFDIEWQKTDSVALFQRVSQSWDLRFLCLPPPLEKQNIIDEQWADAIGRENIMHIADGFRSVDFAMGLVAKRWGHLDDFERNLSARQTPEAVRSVISALK